MLSLTIFSPRHAVARVLFSSLAIIIAAGVWIGTPNRAAAQQDNQEIIGVISGSVTGTYARFAHQMSIVLNSDKIRVLPILGKGSQQNIKDLLYVNGIDIAIVQSDVLDFYRDNQTIPNLENSIRYIGKLYNEEIHIVVQKGVSNIKELEGELVSVGGSGSGTEMTALTLFKALGVTVEPLNVSNQEAINQVKAGNLKAAVFVVGKPGSIIQSIKPEDGLALLPIQLPKSIQGAYFDSRFSSDDYPAVVDPGSTVSTIAVGAVLAVFNWRDGSARYQAMTEFCSNLLAGLPVLQSDESFHPKWREVNLTTEVPGWTRFGGMQQLLQQ